MRIARASAADLTAWAALRAALWPDDDAAAHRAEAERLLLAGEARGVAFVALGPGGAPMGFAEAALRHDYVNGCESSPVLFLEGLFVAPAHRRRGVARALVAAVAAWGRATGAREFASDALLDNTVSHAMHRALGFAETERVVFFRRSLDLP